MRRSQRLVGLLWRWHRRTGVLIFVFLLLLATTGVALNHTTALGLDGSYVRWNWLIQLYGDASAEVRAFPAGEQHWLARAPGGQVFLNTVEVGSCNGQLVGAQSFEQMIVAACQDKLLLIAPDGQLIEAVDNATGLPTPLTGLGVANDALVIEVDGSWRRADLDTLMFAHPAPDGAVITQQSAARLPGTLRSALPIGERWLTWERVLLDLHSGRIAGSGGVLFMDLVGVLLICIASSGLVMWWLHRRRRAGY